MCFILPTLKAVIAIYLEYLGTAPLALLADYQSKGFAIDLIVVCSRHILFLSFLYNFRTLLIGEVGARLAWLQLRLPEKGRHPILPMV
jgi:hypothetical protein